MKLGSLKRGGRDGTLVVVDRKLKLAATVPKLAKSLQQALDDWARLAPELRDVYERLNAGGVDTSFALDANELAAPLPRAYQFLDGSAYLHHVELARRARGAEMPARLYEDPLMYQGVSDPLLGPRDPISLLDESHGLDFEAEVAVITDDVPLGVSGAHAAQHVKLLVLLNDVSLRNLIPAEIEKGFGFVQGKPPSALSEVAVTPDELGVGWRDSKVHLPLRSALNGVRFGDPDAGTDMAFDFAQLIAHAAKTRPLGAGTIIGSGTVSNRDQSRGSSCIAERRMLEQLVSGAPATPFLRPGDRVRIEMLDSSGRSLFGAIDQRVQSHPPG
ncbi:MAG: fumarylacetoacetate hydrolase family protein [Polyangiales bacterium]